MVMTSLAGGELFTDYSDHPPRKLVTLNPKLRQQLQAVTSFFPVGGMPIVSSLAQKISLPKAGRCGIAAD